MIQCFSGLVGIFLFFLGISLLYTAFFKRATLVEGHPKASLAITTAIALVMGSLIMYVGSMLLFSAIG